MAINRLIFTVPDNLVDGDLTDTGIQYSIPVDTTVADTDVVVLTKAIDHGLVGNLLELRFGLTAEFRAVNSANADLKWQWQARNKNGTWVSLHDYITETNIGTTYVSRSRSGYKFATTNINVVPLEVRLIFQCNEANEGRARVKNSSYVYSEYTVDI